MLKDASVQSEAYDEAQPGDPWAGIPRRYDPENVQLLCRDCHTWKHRQVREWDLKRTPT
jgi:hypothetical protein